MATPLIHIKDLKKVFVTDEVETHALSNIHLDIHKGDYVSISTLIDDRVPAKPYVTREQSRSGEFARTTRPPSTVNLVSPQIVVRLKTIRMGHISNSDAAWIAFAALVPTVLYLLFSWYQTRQTMSIRQAVIDKFSSAQDFAEFLRSPAGREFIAGFSGSDNPARTVLGGIQKGIVLAALGGGVWWTGTTFEKEAEVASIGVLLLCVGVGILVAAGISYRLSKSWGLMEKPPAEGHVRSAGK